MQNNDSDSTYKSEHFFYDSVEQKNIRYYIYYQESGDVLKYDKIALLNDEDKEEYKKKIEDQIEKFGKFSQIKFTKSADKKAGKKYVIANLTKGSYDEQIRSDNFKKSFAYQAFLWLGAHEENLVQMKDFTRSPLMSQSSTFADKLNDVRKSNLMAIVFDSSIERCKHEYGPDARIAHLIAYLLKNSTMKDIAEAYYNAEGSAYLIKAKNQIISQIISPSGIFMILMLVAYSIFLWTMLTNIIQFSLDQIDKYFRDQKLIESASFSINLKEWILSWFYTKNLPLENTLSNVVLDDVVKKQVDAYIKEFLVILKHNKSLTPEQRRAGYGLEFPSLLLSGPPGNGKTMLNEGIVAKLYETGYVHVVMFSGSAVSTLPANKVVKQLNRIIERCNYYYINFGIVTIFKIEEIDGIFQYRFAPNVDENRRNATTKMLDIMSKTSNYSRVFLVTTNVDIRDKEKAGKILDPAIVNRFETSSIFVPGVSDTEEGRRALCKIFMQDLRRIASKIPMKVDSNIGVYMQEHIHILTALYPTPRGITEMARKLVMSVAVEKRKGKKRITLSDAIKFIEKQVEKQEYEKSFEYEFEPDPDSKAVSAT